MVTMIVDALPDPPCPKAGITVQGLAVGEQVITVWRVAGKDRVAVRGAKRVEVVDSAYFEDFEVPLGRDVVYELEVISGADADVHGVTATVAVGAAHGVVHDPLDPSTAVPVHGMPGETGQILVAGSFAQLTYEASVSKHVVLGASAPVVIGGRRMPASGVSFSLLTEAEAENTRMRELVMASPVLVIRGLPSWGSRVPPSATYAADSVTESANLPGDDVATVWTTTGDVVRSSAGRVVISLFSYQDVEQLFATYAEKEDAVNGGTYLDDQKAPLGVGR